MRLIPYISRCEKPVRWSPVRTDFFDHLFKEFPFAGFPSVFEKGGGVPAVDILEKDGNLILRADLPGVDEKDIDVKVEGNVLTLKGERKLENEENRDSYRRVESFQGSFSRSFTLPETVDYDNIKAAFKNGILTITLGQKPEAKPREIPVSIN